MTRPLLALLLALSTTALADKNFESEDDGNTHDCGSDGRVNVNYDGASLTLSGACTEININAKNVKVTVDDVDDININGSKNTVKTGTLGKVTINGAGNKVTYKKAKSGKKPGATVLGKGNSVVKK